MGSKLWQQRSLRMVSGPYLEEPDALRHPELLLRPAAAITSLDLAELQQRLQQAQTLEDLPAFEPQRVLEGNEAAIFEAGEPRGLYCALWCGVWAHCALGLIGHGASIRINPDRQSIRLVSKMPAGWPVYSDFICTALNLAVDLIEACIEESNAVAARLQPRLEAFLELAAVRKHGFSNFLIRAATQRGIACLPRLIESSSKAPLLQFGVGAGSRLIRASSSDAELLHRCTDCRIEADYIPMAPAVGAANANNGDAAAAKQRVSASRGSRKRGLALCGETRCR